MGIPASAQPPSAAARTVEILAAYRRMAASASAIPSPDDVPAGWSPPPDAPFRPEQLGTCTITARHLAKILGGVVAGYDAERNPTARVGALEGGHDFALIDGRWILDWWATEYYAGSPPCPGVIDLATVAGVQVAEHLYGDHRRWTATRP